jgi:hypothetical protein
MGLYCPLPASLIDRSCASGSSKSKKNPSQVIFCNCLDIEDPGSAFKIWLSQVLQRTTSTYMLRSGVVEYAAPKYATLA